MKIIDFDGMFDEKLSAYISANADKYKEEEWEDVIPALYKKFGDTVIKSLGVTPRKYYAAMDDDALVNLLKAHLNQGVAVPEFLFTEIEKRRRNDLLLPLLDGTPEECGFVINLIGADDKAIKKYLRIAVTTDDEELKEKCADYVKEKADLVADDLLAYYKAGREKELMLEIMSRTVVKNDDIFDVLIKEFRTADENLPVRAGYLASYGDERALKYLLDKIDEEGISFLEFRELKYAIECLGGKYEKERDFSDDPLYKLIKPEN